MKDFYTDIQNTFPEYKEQIVNILSDLNVNNKESEYIKNLLSHCKNIYPSRFFDLLYQNEEIFNDETVDTEFLPNIAAFEIPNVAATPVYEVAPVPK